MLRSVHAAVLGRPVSATDGAVGHVKDLLFDDRAWTVRHLVLDTGDRLPGRRVLIPPGLVGPPGLGGDRVELTVARATVEAAPTESTDLPVSRQHEVELSAFYGWSPYGGVGPEVGEALAPELMAEALHEERPGDPHLRSAREVIGYRIEATDGAIGHVEDLIVDEATWVVRYAGVATRHWLSHHRMLIGAGWITDIDWLGRSAIVGHTRRAIEGAPAWDPERPIDAELEGKLRLAFGPPERA